MVSTRSVFPEKSEHTAKASKRNTESLAFNQEHRFYGMQTSADSSPIFCRLAVSKKVQAYMLIVLLRTAPDTSDRDPQTARIAHIYSIHPRLHGRLGSLQTRPMTHVCLTKAPELAFWCISIAVVRHEQYVSGPAQKPGRLLMHLQPD